MIKRKKKSQKHTRSEHQDQLEAEWFRRKAEQPGGTVDDDDEDEAIERLRTRNSNDVAVGVYKMAQASESKILLAAFREIIRLGLDGPDWQSKLTSLVDMQERCLEGEQFDRAFILLAGGASEREAAEDITAYLGAKPYYQEGSFNAGAQHVRTRPQKLPCAILRLFLRTPLGERRKGLKIARNMHEIEDGKVASLEESFDVMRSFLMAYHKVDDLGYEKLIEDEWEQIENELEQTDND